MTRKRPSAKSAAKTAVGRPARIAQPHGGALYEGGVPGNGGGTGRPPSIVRARLRESFEKRIPLLEQIADGEVMVKVRVREGVESESLMSAAPGDRIRALDLLAKYGLGAAHALTVEEVRDRLRATLHLIQEQLSPDAGRQLIAALREVWTQ